MVDMTPDQKLERIKKALDRGNNPDWEEVRAGLVDGRYQFFENDHGVCITEVVQAKRKRFLQCWIVAGELPGVMGLQDTVEKHGRDHSCAFMTTTARLGWEKVLPQFGWKKARTIFTKDLSHA